MAESFYHREYTYDRMGTGKRHASAREMSVEGKIIDTISAWTRRVILGIPSHSPRGRPTSAAIRRVYESLLNLATGATFGETRIWGLQSNFFDFNVYFRKLGSEGVLALHHALYEHVVMAGITRSDFFAGLSSRKRTLTHPAWNKIDQVAQQEVEKYHAACWQGVDSETTPGVPSTTSRLRIVDYFISGDRAPPVGLLPPIPASWWGKSIQHVPHYRLTKISDDGNTEVDLEAAQDRQTELVLRAGKRKRTTQRSSSPSLSAGTVSGSSSSRRPSEVKRPKEEKDGTSQTSNAPSLEKPSEESKAKPLDRKRFAALWTKDRNL